MENQALKQQQGLTTRLAYVTSFYVYLAYIAQLDIDQPHCLPGKL